MAKVKKNTPFSIFIFSLSLLCSMIFVNGRVRTGARAAHPQVVPDPSEHCALRGAPMGSLVLAVAGGMEHPCFG